jgi:small RNA 2'-O-methyltransferase
LSRRLLSSEFCYYRIEHVFPDVFEEIPYNIFNEIKPKIALFTTPNSDFNELFEMEPGKFRHYDHKFEWTRDEFKDWAENICARFPNYSVLLTGIGKGPENSAHLGCCSQMAVFIRKDLIEHIENFDENQVKIDDNDDETEESKLPIIESEDYKLIHSVAYPFFKDRRTLEEKLECEIDYSINSLRYYEDDYYNYEENQIQIPIQCIYNSCSNVSEDCDAIKKLLEKKYVIRDDHVILPSNDQSESDCDN